MTYGLIGGISRSWQSLFEPFRKGFQSDVMAFGMPSCDQSTHLGEPNTIFKNQKRWKSKNLKAMKSLAARFIFNIYNLERPVVLPSRLLQCSAESALTTDLQSIGSRRTNSWRRIRELCSPILGVFEPATTLGVKSHHNQPVSDEGVKSVIVGLSYSHHSILRWRGRASKAHLRKGTRS
jgi:hypothetical protein